MAASPPGTTLGSRSRRSWIAAAVVAVLVVGGAVGAWYLFLRPTGPAAVDLSNVQLPASAAPAASSAVAGGGSSGSGGGSIGTPNPKASPSLAAASGGSAGPASAGLDGSWTIDPSLGTGDAGSFVGYRAQEQLASIGANTAVGRTSDVTGTFTLAGAAVTAGSFTADLTTLASDNGMRDGMIHRAGLQSDQFPNATFELTSPIALGSLPADGTIVTAQAKGKLTIHGQTRDVTIPLQAKRSGSTIAIDGSLPIHWADYGMQAPTTAIALSVADPVTLELQLLFSKQ